MGCVAAVNDAAPTPADLSLAWQCQRWGCLPDAGGLLDQDHVLLSRMTAALNVYNTLEQVRNSHGAEIHRLTSGQRTLIKYLMDEGLM